MGRVRKQRAMKKIATKLERLADEGRLSNTALGAIRAEAIEHGLGEKVEKCIKEVKENDSPSNAKITVSKYFKPRGVHTSAYRPDFEEKDVKIVSGGLVRPK